MARIITVGEALVEVMRSKRDAPLDRPSEFVGPYPSGAPAIFASAAARLGASVGFVGTVGRDPFGDCLVRRLEDDGIDCSALQRAEDRLTGIAFVAYRSDGGRSFVFHLPDSAAALVDVQQIPPALLADAIVCHVMGSSLTISETMRETVYWATREVKARGGRVSLDPNLRPELMPLERIRSLCAPILELADLVLPSGEELTMLTGCATPEEGAKALLREGIELVALKQGERGSTLYTAGESIQLPPYSVKEVDPTGAGDCFDAALIAGLDWGWPLPKAGLYANAVGALATTRMGPMEGTFSHAQVTHFMSAQGRPLPQD